MYVSFWKNREENKGKIIVLILDNPKLKSPLIHLTLMKASMTNSSTGINYAYIQSSFKRLDVNNLVIIGKSVFFTTNSSLLPKRTQPVCIL